MAGEQRENVPTLQEETREARGRVLELLVGAVLISTLLSLAINFVSTLLQSVLDTEQAIIITIICMVVVLVLLLISLSFTTTTVKEFHEETEILLPLLVSAHDIEVVRLAYYDDITDLAHAALARRPAEERKELAQLLLSPHDESNMEARRKIVALMLEFTQFLLLTEVVRGSRRLLGPEAAYHKDREVARLQTGVINSEWRQVAALAPGNRYVNDRVSGVPERVTLPEGARLALPDVATHVFGKVRKQDRANPGLEYVPLVETSARRDRALRVSALATFSAHALPSTKQPKRGRTARSVLRNAREARLRARSIAEEEAANQLADAEQRPAAERAELAARHTEAWKKLYDGNQKPYLMRLFVRFDGRFSIRLLASERRQRGLYAWATALSRQLAHTDVEVFLATLKDIGQRTPRRSF